MLSLALVALSSCVDASVGGLGGELLACQHRDADDNSLCDKCGESYSDEKDVEDHTHDYNKQVVADKYLATAADYENAATYYYSCICGEKGTTTFINGKPLLRGTKGLEYTLNKDGESYSVTGIGVATDTDIVISSVYNGKPITDIGDSAFYRCRSLTSVVIGDSVKTIGYRAFSSCDSLESVVIGDGVETIGSSAFDFCDSLTSVVIPSSVKKIGGSAFYDCDSLTSVVIGNSVTTICSSAFSNCDSLIYNEYDNAYYLGNEDNPYVALIKAKYKDITSCIINSNTKVISDSAFYNCSSLTSVEIGDSVETIGMEAFYNCDSLTSIIIPDSVTSIGYGSFWGCSSLTKVVMGDSVKKIGQSAFFECTSLEGVYISNIASWCKIEFVTPMDNPSSNPLYYANNLYIEEKLVTNLIIPEGITSIVKGAFCNCTSLTSIIIPDSVTSIGYSAFSGCTSLESVVIPNSVETIGNWAFFSCDSLTSVVIGDSVETIGSSAFSYCTSLESIKYRGTEEEWEAISKGSKWNYNTDNYTVTYNYDGE